MDVVNNEPREKLHLSDLVSFAYQVSRGMEYLESKKVCISVFLSVYIFTDKETRHKRFDGMMWSKLVCKHS